MMGDNEMTTFDIGTYDREKTKEAIEKEIFDYESSLKGFEKQFFSNIPALYKNQYLKSKKMLLSPRAAIRLNCIHCCGWSLKEAQLCASKSCPMFEYRPKPKHQETVE